jgi:hypothetical protein
VLLPLRIELFKYRYYEQKAVADFCVGAGIAIDEVIVVVAED